MQVIEVFFLLLSLLFPFMRPLSRDVNPLECFISVLYFDLPVTSPHAVHCDSYPVWGMKEAC